jgi:uncharacterized membrane protein YfcA
MTNFTPEIRALVKVMFLLLVIMVGSLVAAYVSLLYGPGILMIVLSLVLLAYLMKVFYHSQVAEEQYRDTLREIQETIRGESSDQD